MKKIYAGVHWALFCVGGCFLGQTNSFAASPQSIEYNNDQESFFALLGPSVSGATSTQGSIDLSPAAGTSNGSANLMVLVDAASGKNPSLLQSKICRPAWGTSVSNCAINPARDSKSEILIAVVSSEQSNGLVKSVPKGFSKVCSSSYNLGSSLHPSVTLYKKAAQTSDRSAGAKSYSVSFTQNPTTTSATVWMAEVSDTSGILQCASSVNQAASSDYKTNQTALLKTSASGFPLALFASWGNSAPGYKNPQILAVVPTPAPTPAPTPVPTPSPTPVAALPDLIVSSVSMTPANPVVGDAVTFSATVKNQGRGATPSGVVIGVSFQIDGNQVTWSDTDQQSLAPGASIVLSANFGPTNSAVWTATSGAHVLQAFVNDVNRFPETDMTNNILNQNITVAAAPTPTPSPSPTPVAGLPDLVVSSIAMSPTNPKAGDSVSFSATVKNQGGATPSGIVIGVSFSIDGGQVTWSDTDSQSLASGASIVLTANSGPSGSAVWNATNGNHVLQANVNDIGRFPETNMNNNTLNLNFTVGSVATPSPTPPPGTYKPLVYDSSKACINGKLYTNDVLPQTPSAPAGVGEFGVSGLDRTFWGGKQSRTDGSSWTGFMSSWGRHQYNTYFGDETDGLGLDPFYIGPDTDAPGSPRGLRIMAEPMPQAIARDLRVMANDQWQVSVTSSPFQIPQEGGTLTVNVVNPNGARTGMLVGIGYQGGENTFMGTLTSGGGTANTNNMDGHNPWVISNIHIYSGNPGTVITPNVNDEGGLRAYNFPAFYSGAIDTNVNQEYGFFVARLRVPKAAPGASPAFWMLETQGVGLNNGQLMRDEIDIQEQFGNDYGPNGMNSGAILWNSQISSGGNGSAEVSDGGGMVNYPFDPSADYHDWGVLISPGGPTVPPLTGPQNGKAQPMNNSPYGGTTMYVDGLPQPDKMGMYDLTQGSGDKEIMAMFQVAGANSWLDPGGQGKNNAWPLYYWVQWLRVYRPTNQPCQ